MGHLVILKLKLSNCLSEPHSRHVAWKMAYEPHSRHVAWKNGYVCWAARNQSGSYLIYG